MAFSWTVPPIPTRLKVPLCPPIVRLMDCSLLEPPQPKRLVASRAHPNAAIKGLRVTAEYLQRKSSASWQQPSPKARSPKSLPATAILLISIGHLDQGLGKKQHTHPLQGTIR